MKKFTKQELFSIPNILTYIRILLIPLFIFLYYTAATSNEKYYIPAACVIAISGLTDLLDGQIARRCGMITEWGKFIDPVADKLTQGALVICMAVFRYPLMWLLVGLFVAKEGFLSVMGVIMLRKGKKLNGALWYGKVCTTVFYFCVLALLVFNNIDMTTANVFIIICGALMAFAMIMYMNVYCKIWHDITKPEEPKRIKKKGLITDLDGKEV